MTRSTGTARSMEVSISEALVAARQALPSAPGLALAQLREVIRVRPTLGEAHRLSALALRALGRVPEAEAADLEAARMAVHDEPLMRAAAAMVDNELHVAEPILKGRLREQPTDIAAMRLLAELAARIGRLTDAENLLRRAVELAPAFGVARANLATVLFKQSRFAEALEELNYLPPTSGDDLSSAALRAAALGRIGGYEEALELYRALNERFPRNAGLAMSRGHILKTMGRVDEAVEAYRQAIATQPSLGEAWWSLANLKTVRFTMEDISAMEAALQTPDLGNQDSFHLHFALGKALGDVRRWERSFHHYVKGNAERRNDLDYDAAAVEAHVSRVIDLFTPEILASREGQGFTAPDPIFILGMPRAGSTLIEQILASHPAVEGTMELPDMPLIATDLAREEGGEPGAWARRLLQCAPDRLAALGADYIGRTRVQRKSDRPFFIDKLPNNWIYTGLIHLILPHAKIIDARRDPMDCGFSNFCQHFARGQAFSYDLRDIGRYYADYVRLMRHFDAVLPGRVHRVLHESLLADPEGEVRRMLDYLGLPFDPACLRFHENARPVRTASSEQVRRPLNREGVGRWQPYEPWLTPLREALGDIDWRR